MNIIATAEKLIKKHGTCNLFEICKDPEIIAVFNNVGS